MGLNCIQLYIPLFERCCIPCHKCTLKVTSCKIVGNKLNLYSLYNILAFVMIFWLNSCMRSMHQHDISYYRRYHNINNPWVFLSVFFPFCGLRFTETFIQSINECRPVSLRSRSHAFSPSWGSNPVPLVWEYNTTSTATPPSCLRDKTWSWDHHLRLYSVIGSLATTRYVLLFSYIVQMQLIYCIWT